MPSRILALACVAIALALPPQPAAAQSGGPTYQSQLRREATLFFADVLPQLDLGHAPCTFFADWTQYGVPADLFGLNAHAELVPPNHGTRPAEILDPTGQETEWLCDRAEFDALVLDAEQQAQLFDSAFDSARVSEFGLTFPVFSENFDRAVIVLFGLHITLFRPENGNPPTVRSQTGGGEAIIFERQDDHWTLLRRYELFHFH